MTPPQRGPPFPFAVWPWGLLPAALQPVWVQDTTPRSPLHPLLLVVPEDRMILMELTDFWKTNSLKSHPWAASPKLQVQFKNLDHLFLKFRRCDSTWSCRLILYKTWHCFQAEQVHHADAPSQKKELLCALCKAFIIFIIITHLLFMHLIWKRGNTMTQRPSALSSSLWDSFTCLRDFLPCLLLPKPQFQVSCSKCYLHWENWWCCNISSHSFWSEQASSRRQVN